MIGRGCRDPNRRLAASQEGCRASANPLSQPLSFGTLDIGTVWVYCFPPFMKRDDGREGEAWHSHCLLQRDNVCQTSIGSGDYDGCSDGPRFINTVDYGNISLLQVISNLVSTSCNQVVGVGERVFLRRLIMSGELRCSSLYYCSK